MKYFISYFWTRDGGFGFGSVDENRDAPITNGSDIAAICNEIREAGDYETVTIVNWRRYE